MHSNHFSCYSGLIEILIPSATEDWIKIFALSNTMLQAIVQIKNLTLMRLTIKADIILCDLVLVEIRRNSMCTCNFAFGIGWVTLSSFCVFFNQNVEAFFDVLQA